MKTEKTERSPITGQDCVIVELVNDKTSKICMESGYMTNSDFLIDNTELLEKYEASMPELMIATKFIEIETGQVWYLTSVQFRTGMIYPQPSDHDVYEWAFTPVLELDEEERKNYPVPGKDGSFYDTRLATEHSELYNKNSFKSACKRAGAVIDVNE